MGQNSEITGFHSLHFCFRLFYAGACEGQMPEILTMIQINRLTPTPAVLCIVRYICNQTKKKIND